MSKLKVAHFFGKMDMGGAETFIMNVFRKIHYKVEFIFILNSNDKGKYDDEIIKLGGKIYYVKNRKNIYEYYKEIKKIHLKEKFEIAHTHVHYFSGINAFILKLLNVKNVISHSHNINDGEEDRFIRNIYRRSMSFLIKINSNKLLACSKEAGISLYSENSKFEVINNAIDLEKFSIKSPNRELLKELNLGLDDFIIGHVGRFEKQKNHDFLIEIFSKVLKYNNNAKLILIGEGYDKERIIEKCFTMNLENNVRFLGNRNDVDKLMSIFNVFLFPSLYEGLGIVLIEAQAMGLRCITSNTVPNEVDLTGNVSFLDLKSNHSVWVNEILNGKLQNSKNNILEYDIKNISERIFNIYNGG